MFFPQDKESQIRDSIISYSDYMEKALNSGLSFLEGLSAYLLDCQDYGRAYIALQEALKENPESDYAKEMFFSLDEMRKKILASPIYEKKYVITGALFGMERNTALELIAFFGGKVSDNPVNDMDVLVVGYSEWSELNNGKPTRKILKAQELQRKGRNIEIISDEHFLKRLSSIAKQILPTNSYQYYFSGTNY